MQDNREIMQPNSSANYRFDKTCSDGFGSYWYQVREVLQEEVKSVLVIGQGDNIVPYVLRSQGLEVDTFDLVQDMNPTYYGNVIDIEKLVKKEYDCILCCEVLEHLPFENFEEVLKQFNKIATKRIVISLPVFGLSGYIKVKAPKFIDFTVIIAVPFYKFGHHFMSKEHYWEINARGTKRKQIESILFRNFKLIDRYRVKDVPYHMFYIFKPQYKPN